MTGRSFFLFFILFSSYCFAQKKLRVGEKIPFSRIDVLDKDNKKTGIDLPNGKNSTTDRFVVVLFYTPQQPVKHLVEINQKIEQILNRFQNNACKGASEIEYVTICAETKPEVWQAYLNDANLGHSKFSGKKTNYLAKGGLKDDAIKVFGVDKFPSFFVVNPKGRLFLEADSTPGLERAFNTICRTNAAASTSDIAGKLLVGDKSKTPLKQHGVFLVNQKQDTLKKTRTDNFGDFVFDKVDTTQNLSIKIEVNEKVKGGPRVYIAKQSGEVVSEIKANKQGVFEYKLLKADVVTLSPVEIEDDITMKYKRFEKSGQKNLTVTENIYYELGKFTVTYEGEIVLDQVISILQADPSVKLEVISHTDSQGEDASNLSLSQKRAGSVVDYLLSKGIDKNRLKAVGKGESAIRNRCANGVDCSDKEHEYNRRTEFNFVKN
jgi:outer membrane protein OmpA-like peptidoglycan-associated protein